MHLTPRPVISTKGLCALTFVETEARPWINGFGQGSPTGEFICYADYNGDHFGKPLSSSTDLETLWQTYEWGECRVRFEVDTNKTLKISGYVLNNSESTLGNVDLNICKIDFPKDGAQVSVQSSFAPGYLSFDASAGDIPCHFAFSDNQGWPGEIAIGQENWGNNAMYARKVTLPPGGAVSFWFALDFVTLASELEPIQAAVNAVFAQTYPQIHRVSDARVVGQIFWVTGSAGSGWVKDPVKWATNPRGWLDDPSLDPVTRFDEFRNRMLAYATRCVDNALPFGSAFRGFLSWDTEGEQHSHGVSVYYGHASWVEKIAPEFDAIADDLFRVFSDAGFEIGFCLRHNKLAESTNTSQAFYNSPWPNMDGHEALLDLHRQITYCQARWGRRATIYYVDSNQGFEVNVYEKLAELHPDCTIAPECFSIVPRLYRSTAPYQTGRAQEHVRNGLATQKKYSDIYPQAQSLVNYADVADNEQNQAGVVAALKRGDIAMVRIWFPTAEASLVLKATAQAYAEGWSGL
jgi:hypothetical protein